MRSRRKKSAMREWTLERTIKELGLRKNKTGVFALIVALLLSISTAIAAPNPKSGASCAKKGLSKTYKGKQYTCIKSGKKLVWSKGVLIKSASGNTSPSTVFSPTPSPSQSPTPQVSPSPAATPSPLPSPTITQSTTPAPSPSSSPTVTLLTVEERWNATGSNALVVYKKWASQFKGQTPSAEVRFILSDSLWPEVKTELRQRINKVIVFFDPYFKPSLPIYFIGGRFEDVDWACRELNRLDNGRDIEECKRESINNQKMIFHDSWGGGIRNASAHWYLLKMREAIDSRAFLPRVEHEYIHIIQQNQMGNFSTKESCWYHGMAEYLGILASAQGNLDYFLDQRMWAILNAPVKRPQDLTSEFLKNWITRASIPNRTGNQRNCAEFDQSGDYHDAVLAAEWMISKIGIPGVLKFQENLKDMNWNQALEKSFGLSVNQIYTEISEYMLKEIMIARENLWVTLKTCYEREPGPIKDPPGCKF